MTSSARTSFGRNVRRAGQALGIDLAGLFADEDESTGGFEGFTPSFKVTSQRIGRSPSTLRYKAPLVTPGETVFKLTETPASLIARGEAPAPMRPEEPKKEAPAAPAPAPAPAPVAKAFTYTDPGDKGAFGMKDYNELAGQGVSITEMRKIAQASPYGVGTAAAKLLDMKPYTETKPWIQPGGQPTYSFTDPGSKNVFGLEDYYELLRQDIPKVEMTKVAKSMSGGIGSEAAKALGLEQYSYVPAEFVSASTQQKAATPSYTYTDPGDKGAFGMKDYEELQKQNVGLDEMRRLAGQAQYGVGTKAAELLGMQPYTVTHPNLK